MTHAGVVASSRLIASKFDQTSIVDNIHNNQSKPLDNELRNQRNSKHEGALRAKGGGPSDESEERKKVLEDRRT